MIVLHEDLQNKLNEIRNERAFDCKKWLEDAAVKINNYFAKSGLSGAVVGCSGGVDSSLVLAVLDWTMKNTESPLKKILPVALPIRSTASIQNRASELCDQLGLKLFTIDQTDIFDSLEKKICENLELNTTQFASGQLRSYMRTPALYYSAQLLSASGYPSVVVGTGNLDEDFGIYYFCKAGDGVSDINFIHMLHKSQVFEVASFMNLPEIILISPPSGDLWENQTDEEEIGLPYSFVELYLTFIKNASEDELEKFRETLCEDARLQLSEWTIKIEAIRRKNEHKLHIPLFL